MQSLKLVWDSGVWAINKTDLDICGILCLQSTCMVPKVARSDTRCQVRIFHCQITDGKAATRDVECFGYCVDSGAVATQAWSLEPRSQPQTQSKIYKHLLPTYIFTVP